MGEFLRRIGHYLVRPDETIFAVASSLLYPVLFLEVAALLWVAFEAGTLTLEYFARRRARKQLDVEDAAAQIADAAGAADAAKAVAVLSKFDFGPVVGPVARVLSTRPMTRLRLIKVLSDAEQTAIRRLDRTRVFIRLGPILGLMGTLIPISPALVGLAKGDTETLSANLVVAFSTTVVGLLIGATGYLTSLARERMYAQDMADLEYVLEHTGVKR